MSSPEPPFSTSLPSGTSLVLRDTSGNSVIGPAVADTLALVLDPYPRGPNADAALRAAGVMNEEQAGPFAVLAKLKGEKPEP